MSQSKVTNNSDISLEMAVWLLYDDYDYIKEKNYISATGLLKPVRQIVLPPRIPDELKLVPDLEDYIPRAMGQALHAAAEKAWKDRKHVEKAFRLLGFPKSVINRVVVNPTPEQLASIEQPIPIYVEQRTIKEIIVDGVKFHIGGKFDMVAEGRVTDTKSGSVWGWILGSNDESYVLQGSIYRWLNPEIVTEDFMRVNHIFTDWNKLDARTRKDYPKSRVLHRDHQLIPVDEIEEWIRNKIRQVMKAEKQEEPEVPFCTEEELWLTKPQFKYYAKPETAAAGGRSTKNFDNHAEAAAYQASKGGKGVIIATPRIPKRCGYCAAFPICTQKDNYTHD